MIRRPPRSPLFPLPDALPICMSRCIAPRRGALRAGSQHWTKSRALGWGARMATRVASIRGVGVRERATPRMGLAALAAACLALGLLTLAGPATPTYDPYAWLIWGRELLHLDLDTRFGPSWKPLPVLFTTLLS